MKQRITAKQLQELTEEQKQRLREWWKPQCYDIYYDTIFDDFGIALTDEQGNISGCVAERKESLLPLLSIGQMIELLSANKDVFDIGKCYSLYSFRPYGDQTTKQDKELCDALWEAVKRVL